MTRVLIAMMAFSIGQMMGVGVSSVSMDLNMVGKSQKATTQDAAIVHSPYRFLASIVCVRRNTH